MNAVDRIDLDGAPVNFSKVSGAFTSGNSSVIDIRSGTDSDLDVLGTIIAGGAGGTSGIVWSGNDSSVYLHDTPDRSLFERTNRDFSHGCVRVSRPDELADLLLRRNGGWNINSVRAAMQDVNAPNRKEEFSRSMPVYLIYWTSTIMVDGRVRFDQDIYGHDVEMYQKFGLQ